MTYKQAMYSYQRAQQAALPPRYMEKATFAQAISMLKQARESIDDYQVYAVALQFNQRLWTYIQSRLAENDADMPGETRTKLLALSVFIDRHTFSALATPEVANLAPLIDINVEISRGLDADTAIQTTTANDRIPFNGFRPN